jgi:protein-L-isoaspartate(D-aspartate) O-methyltransferase
MVSSGRFVLLFLGLLALSGDSMRLFAQSQSFVDLRRDMVEQQIVKRGVTEPGVLDAMEQVPRHQFVPDSLRDRAYVDSPLAIGSGQTISQPYVVALMTSLLELDGDERVLEIGTGSGYQAAVLSRLAMDVFTVEIRESLGRRAEQTIAALGYTNVHIRIGDGYQGWPEEAPFDGIIVTAAPESIPEPLIDQLKVGGKLVIPLGDFFQDLVVITKTPDGIEKKEVIPVRFVPMIGEVEEKKERR